QPVPSQLHAPAVVVKIDNIDAARPQTGVGHADVVYEELVEGGLTRLAAVFQSQYPTTLGPVRSGRTTDLGILDDLNHPVFVFAGANGLFLPIIRAQPITDVDINNHPGLFVRSSSRSAPHNLYTNVASDAAQETVSGGPPALFAFRAPGTPLSSAGIQLATHATLSWPATRVTWIYDSQKGVWLRSQNGTPDTTTSGQQLGATNVVIQSVSYVTAAIASGEGVAPAAIPQGQLVGSGPVWILSGDHSVKGTWTRSSLSATTLYTDAAGAPIPLSPGGTWVELLQSGTTPAIG
ncbi:MAG: DUF3048 domain-containing protein, partial [Acidimicrobiales bacterium]